MFCSSPSCRDVYNIGNVCFAHHQLVATCIGKVIVRNKVKHILFRAPTVLSWFTDYIDTRNENAVSNYTQLLMEIRFNE